MSKKISDKQVSKSSNQETEQANARPSAKEIDHVEDSEECESWWDFFKMFDKNNDGVIPVKRMKRAIRKNKNFFRIDEDQVNDLVHECDRNDDGLIDFPEFCEIMAKAKKQHLTSISVAIGRIMLPKGRQADAANYLVEYTCCPPPLFILYMTILEIAMYFYFAKATITGIHAEAPAPICNNVLSLNPGDKYEVWRYFTYVFLHNGWGHLLGNMTMQVLLGFSLELVHKAHRICVLYFMGAFTGGLLFFVFDPDIYLVGASAGVYALITAHLADAFLNWSEMPFRWFRVALFGVWVGADFGYAAYKRYGTNQISQVAVTGHIGGAIAGGLLGFVVLKNLEQKKWEKIVWWICLVAYIVFNVICIIFVYTNVKMHSINIGKTQ